MKRYSTVVGVLIASVENVEGSSLEKRKEEGGGSPCFYSNSNILYRIQLSARIVCEK